MVEKNLGLAQKISHDYVEHSSTYDLEDVVSVAYQGLIRAAILFDPNEPRIRPGDLENGKAFAGFASLKINGAILDWQREIDYVTRSYRSIYKRLRLIGYGSTKTKRHLPELAAELELPLEKVREAIRAVETPAVSLNITDDEADDGLSTRSSPNGALLNNLTSEQNVEASAVETSILNAFAGTLEQLPQQYQVVIALRYYFSKELQWISQEMGISVAEVREIHSDAVLILHKAMALHAQH